jgi:hypothetical protein
MADINKTTYQILMIFSGKDAVLLEWSKAAFLVVCNPSMNELWVT